MTVIHGFELVKEGDIPELNTKARLYRHARTGAELLSLENADENKTFSITFKTPPPDSTGLPHILEHSVLTGSRKYPTKEPFVELLKSSLNTFLNAMTFSDMTMYPVASTNLKDFYNLVDVYLDSVFHPLISEDTLAQEGWHYDLPEPDAPLQYRGVVFNEMKAAYSVPERVLDEATMSALMPQTPYALSSGGDPAVIPDLTYEQFENYHRTYYHPSNARIVFYGDDDPQERLRLVDTFLSEFEALDVDAELPLQPRFDQPRKQRVGYDAGEAGPDEKRGLVSVSWLLEEITNTEEMLALDILEHILIGTPASPLRKALIDSGLGEDLIGGGFSPYQRQATFTTGMKGIAVGDADRIEELILATLRDLAQNGIDRATTEASLNTVEFALREMNTGSYPRGLMIMITALPAWLHGADPIERLSFEAPLNRIKAHYQQDPHYFESLIRRYLLENPHRSTVVLEPDPTVGPARERAERERLDRYYAELDENDRRRLYEYTHELRRLQEAPDKPEDLAKIPGLTVDDLEREIKRVPREEQHLHGAPLLYHALPTSGIVYLDLGLDLRALTPEQLPYLSVFGRALLQMGTEQEDFVQLSQRIGAKTGGISPMVTLNTKMDRSGPVARMFLRGKAMAGQTDDLLAILRDILLTVRLDNRERFKQLVLEKKARAEAYINMVGHSLVTSRLRGQFTEADYAHEQISGVSSLFFLRDLARRIDEDWPGVLATLEDIRARLVNRSSMLINITAEEEHQPRLVASLGDYLAELPACDAEAPAWGYHEGPAYEALTAPAQVNFVAKGANLYDLGYELTGAHVTVIKYLNLNYIWNRVRVQGGAYGSSLSFDRMSGVAVFRSWRDPNLLETLQVYDGAGDYLLNLKLSQDDLEKAIIGAIGQMDSYQLPDAKGFSSTLRYLLGYSDEMRQQIRDQVLATTPEDFQALGRVLQQFREAGRAAVLCAPERVRRVNETAGGMFQVTPVL